MIQLDQEPAALKFNYVLLGRHINPFGSSPGLTPAWIKDAKLVKDVSFLAAADRSSSCARCGFLRFSR